MELDIVNNKEENRFEVYIEDMLSQVIYNETPAGYLAILSTKVPKELGGRGIAGELTKFALEYARSNNLIVKPICSYTQVYIEKYPEYKDLLEDRK